MFGIVEAFETERICSERMLAFDVLGESSFAAETKRKSRLVFRDH